MLLWNSIAAQVTFHKLSENLRILLISKQLVALEQDGVDLETFGPFYGTIVSGCYLASSMIDYGVVPILPRNPEKWYPMQQPQIGFQLLIDGGEKMLVKAIEDFKAHHGVNFEDFSQSNGPFPPTTEG